MSDPYAIKIIITYDQCLMAEGLAALLSKHKDLRVIDLYENETFLKTKTSNIQADILIIEIENWFSKQIEYIKEIKIAYPDIKLLVISETITGNQLEILMQYIDGFVLKKCTAEKPAMAIREIFGAGKYLCPKAVDIIFNNKNHHENHSELTLREKEILASWLTSKNNTDLALKLNISQSTVRTHLKNIRQKLGDVTHIQLMNYACKQNILKGNFMPICKNCKSFCNS